MNKSTGLIQGNAHLKTIAQMFIFFSQWINSGNVVRFVDNVVLTLLSCDYPKHKLSTNLNERAFCFAHAQNSKEIYSKSLNSPPTRSPKVEANGAGKGVDCYNPAVQDDLCCRLEMTSMIQHTQLVLVSVTISSATTTCQYYNLISTLILPPRPLNW